MADTTYLKKKHNTWMVVVDVPKHLRAAAGLARFKRSLKTDSLATANRLKHSHVAEFKRKLALIETGQGDPNAALYKLAAEFRQALETSDRRWHDGPNDHEYSHYEEELDRLKQQAKDIEEDQGPETASRFFKAAKGEATPLRDLYATWVAEADVVKQTKAQHTSAVKRYLSWAGEHVTVEESDRQKAGKYVSHLLAKGDITRKTIKRHLSSLSSLWNWLQTKGHVDEGANPWLAHKLGKKPRTSTRTGLTNEMLLKLLRGSYSTLKFRQLLSDLLRLALLHGARLDELCALRRSDVDKREDGYWISITDGKTDAAVRDIPVHPLALPIIQRRLKDNDEYLFKGLTPGGPDKKRAWYVSKAYGRFRAQVGVKERWQDFHALRHTFTDMMEGQEVPESTVKLLIGHARESMTYGHYSKGQRVQLRSAIEKADYNAEVMDAIAS